MQEMERFREHEKEFKMKQFSKRALQANLEKSGNFVDRGNSSDDDDDDSSDNDSNRRSGSYSRNSNSEYGHEAESDSVLAESDLDGDPGPMDPNQLALDKEWLGDFIQEKLKKQISQVEHEVDNIRNKKIRGTSKKQKDMLKTLNEKLKLMRNTREKCEELAMTMEFLQGGNIHQLKYHLKKYHENHDNETLRTNVDNEVMRLIEMADTNRKDEDLLH